jgi:hypothetical protein
MANALEQASIDLPQDQWRELSTRNAAIPTRGGTGTRSQHPITSPPPVMSVMTVRDKPLRDKPIAGSAVNMPSAARSKRKGRGIVVAALGLSLAAGIGAIVATAVLREDTAAPQPVVVVASSARTDAGSAVAIEAAKQELPDPGTAAPTPTPAVAAPTPPGNPAVASPTVAALTTPGNPAVASPTVAASTETVKPVALRVENKRAPDGNVAQPPANKRRAMRPAGTHDAGDPLASRPPPTAPIDQPAAQPPPPTGGAKTRAEIAKEYKMHPDHVALPGEVPIKRRPRMSRGKYSATSFDYRAFLAQATKLARAEFSDAKLNSLQVNNVGRDGRANISRANPGAVFQFASEQRVDEGCAVTVEVDAAKIETYVESPIFCGQTITLPRCSFAQIWEKALVLGATAEVANLSFDNNGWRFSSPSLHHSFVDDCP